VITVNSVQAERCRSIVGYREHVKGPTLTSVSLLPLLQYVLHALQFQEVLGMSGGKLEALAELLDGALRRPGVSCTAAGDTAVLSLQYSIGGDLQLLQGDWELPLAQGALAPALAASMREHLLARAHGVPEAATAAAGANGADYAVAAAAASASAELAVKDEKGTAARVKRKAGVGMSALNPNFKQHRRKGAQLKSSGGSCGDGDDAV
jgi:hypothetical protein